jgi:hypothetical protein
MFAMMCAAVMSQAPAVGDGLQAAHALLGTPYEWGGRLRNREGLDCLGVVLAAAERASGCGWRSFSTKPTELVAEKVWGSRVAGLDPVATGELKVDQLTRGDVLMLVGFAENPAEPRIGAIVDRPVWVWHVGLYLGDGQFLVGDHHANATIETPLLEYLRAHADEYAGVFVTRGPMARPKACRKHAPLARPPGALSPRPTSQPSKPQ